MQEGEGHSVANVALLEKHAKTRLAVAADHFNRDYKKGFQFLQVTPLQILHSPVAHGSNRCCTHSQDLRQVLPGLS